MSAAEFLAEQKRLAEAVTEAWLPIAGFEGLYEVSDLGRVSSVGHNWRGYGRRIIVAQDNSHGYLKVRLSIAGRRVNKRVHSLVACAFIGERPSDADQIRHLNGNRHDNRAVNLAYGNGKENAADRDGHGTTAKGERNGWARITEATVREVRQLREDGLLYREIAELTGVTRHHARQIVAREVWSHVD